MSFPTYIPDHAQRIIDDDFYNKIRALPRWQAWAEGIGGGVQVLEDQLFAVINGELFDTAVGPQLDQWGSIVNEQRGGLDDDEYRNFIRGRILTSFCGGTADEYIRIWNLITSPNQSVRAVPFYPAGFALLVVRDEPMRDEVYRRVARMMEDAKADGIGMMLIESVVGYFGFEEDPSALGYDVGLYSRSIR